MSSSSDVEGQHRKPMNAFLLFCKRHRQVVKNKYPNLENRNITKILGDWWQNLEESQKQQYVDLAREMKKDPRGGAATAIRTKPAVKGDEITEIMSRGSSSSSSPEPQTQPTAPKPFKKRYLAIEKAKMLTEPPAPVSPAAGSEADDACKALLQLAGVRESSPGSEPNGTHTETKPGQKSKVSTEEEFKVLKQDVWKRVTKTLLKQEEERNDTETASAQPINLSSLCTIRGQTIIEHVIEAIIREETHDRRGLNNNSNRHINKDTEIEEIKERIYQGLKQDILKKREGGGPDKSALWGIIPNPTLNAQQRSEVQKQQQNGKAPPPPVLSESTPPPVSVTLVPSGGGAVGGSPLNLSTSPARSSPPTGVSVTPFKDDDEQKTQKRKFSEDDEEDIRRSARACKGRRYQEFKDEGRLGRTRKGQRSGDEENSGAAEIVQLKQDETWKKPLRDEDFNVTEKLNALPTLSLEAYQQKVLKSKHNPPATETATGASGAGAGSTRSRRKKSGDDLDRRKRARDS